MFSKTTLYKKGKFFYFNFQIWLCGIEISWHLPLSGLYSVFCSAFLSHCIAQSSAVLFIVLFFSSWWLFLLCFKVGWWPCVALFFNIFWWCCIFGSLEMTLVLDGFLGRGFEGLVPRHKRSKRCPSISYACFLLCYLDSGLHAWGVAFFSWKIKLPHLY